MQTALKKNPSFGLTDGEAAESRRRHGENVMPRTKKKSFFKKFITNMGDPVIKILLCALVVDIIFLFGDGNLVETAGIALSIFLATLISTLSEQGSERAFERLEAENRDQKCRVRRAGRVRELSIAEVAVGDTVLLSAGDRIPADGVLLLGRLGVDQSGLNGESREAKKLSGGVFSPSLDSASSLFGGCLVLSGEGEMGIVRVGRDSFLGGISGEIQTDTRQSPLKLRLTKLAHQISVIGYIAAALCAAAYLISSFLLDPPAAFTLPFVAAELLHAFMLGLTVVVMAVPEGLPMMIAVVLSSNIKRMVRDQVLVRKPTGIEAAGSMNILFTDKTGTLTEGKMKVGGIILADGHKYSPKNLAKSAPEIASLYSLFTHFGEAEISENTVVGGNATERALVESGLHLPVPDGFKMSQRVPFDSAKKFSAVRLTGRKNLTLIKGAPEVLMPYITTTLDEKGRECDAKKAELREHLFSPAASGWRVLALCLSHTFVSEAGEFSSLCFVGAVLIADRLRPAAECSVETLRRAGIKVVMITGDNRETAVSVARRCGIVRFDDDLCLTGAELAAMSDEAVKKALPSLRVVARAMPSDKSRLVRLSQEEGLVVGMTGDGVNDAPALKTADIGFAMGSGTGVAKEAGDIVILDNDLSSIAKAVLYGRNIFKSIRKFIVLQLTVNLCAVGVTMIGPFIGIESPVTVVQMLWINIIMDTLGGIAFAGEAASGDAMKEKPKARDEMILNSYMTEQISLLGVFTTVLSVVFLKLPSVSERFGGEGSPAHLTAFFAMFIFAGVFNCFNARTDSLYPLRAISKNPIFTFIMCAVAAIQIGFVYLGGAWLRTVPISPSELAFALALASLVLPFDFLRKLIGRFSGRRGGF